VATRNAGDSDDFKQHMQGLLRDFFTYNKYEDVDTEWETFDAALGKNEGKSTSIWTLCMLLWVHFAQEATLDKSLRDEWRNAVNNSPNQDKLLSILTKCLKHQATTHPSWTRADVESCVCRKPHALAVSLTDRMVELALGGNDKDKQKWSDILQGWFDTDEPAADFFSRANRFLREYIMDGMCIFERVVKTKSYMALMKMTRLAACLFFGYLEARKLEMASAAGAAGGSRALLHGFNSAVSSAGHTFSVSRADSPAGAWAVVVQGLRCVAHGVDADFNMLGPFKTAADFLQRDPSTSPVAPGAGGNASGGGGRGGGGSASFLASRARGSGGNVTAEERERLEQERRDEVGGWVGACVRVFVCVC
jgi:hypothetical protein